MELASAGTGDLRRLAAQHVQLRVFYHDQQRQFLQQASDKHVHRAVRHWDIRSPGHSDRAGDRAFARYGELGSLRVFPAIRGGAAMCGGWSAKLHAADEGNCQFDRRPIRMAIRPRPADKHALARAGRVRCHFRQSCAWGCLRSRNAGVAESCDCECLSTRFLRGFERQYDGAAKPGAILPRHFRFQRRTPVVPAALPRCGRGPIGGYAGPSVCVIQRFRTYCALASAQRDRARQVAPAQQAVSEPYFLPAIIAANLMSTLSTNVDKILAYGSLSLRVLGEYTFAAQIAALLNLFVSSAVAAFSPRFRELYILGDYSQIRRVFMLLSALNNFLVVTAAALFLTNGEFFLSVFKGHIDREALLGTFAILAGAAFISSNLWFPGAIATSTGKPYFSLFTNIGFMAGYLCAFLLLRSRLDDSVFALSMLCAASMTTAAGLVYFKLRVLDFSLLRYGLATVALPILIVVATYVLPALVIKSHFGGNLPGLAFAAAWLVTLLPVAFRGRHLLALRRQHAS